jgi:hypothetical protein
MNKKEYKNEFFIGNKYFSLLHSNPVKLKKIFF